MIEKSERHLVEMEHVTDPTAMGGQFWRFTWSDGTTTTVDDPQQAQQIAHDHHVRPVERYI